MLGIGPHIILDKSVLEMLSGDEFSLLTEYFRLVVPPVLIEEIVADLELKPTERRLPEAIVKRLAERMREALGYQPGDYLRAVGGNLLGQSIAMFGQVPIIGPRPNAYRTSDGAGFIYDRVPEQHFWERLAAGQFAPLDVARAREWRTGISRIDLQKLHRDLVTSAKQAFGPVSSCHDVLLIVDRHMEKDDPAVQWELIKECAAFIGLDDAGQNAALNRWNRLDRPKFRDFAPYAAYVSRLHATFAIGVSTGIVTTRATNAIDLQYLCYAPFAHVFSSGDNFHETMWPAAAGRNTFVHGVELKADLRDRLQRRAAGQGVKRRRSHPPRSDDSVITKVFDIYMPEEKPEDRERERSPQTVDELDPQIRERLKKAWAEIDRRKDG
jgi:hypothetical protein